MSREKVNVVWLQTNLRLTDNMPLSKALKEGLPVVLFFCWSAPIYKHTTHHFPRVGRIRNKFIERELSMLKEACINQNLVFFICKSNDPVHGMIEMEQKYDVQNVFVEHPIQAQEKAMVQQVEKDHSVVVHFENFLIEPNQLPFPVKDTPNLFTQFRKLVEKSIDFERAFQDIEDGLPDNSGVTRLNTFIWETKAIATYKETRNALDGKNFSSHLSPYLALGRISPKQVAKEVKRFERNEQKNASTYWVIFELLWRDFFRYMSLKYGPKLFSEGGIQNLDTKQDFHYPTFERWTMGKLNEPLIDALMNQLRTTGFMSNRGRQIVANYWSKQLKQNWQIGAAWFEHCLIDYDVSSNWGNWQYQAGVGNDKQNRWFNLDKQQKQFDPNFEFIHKYFKP